MSLKNKYYNKDFNSNFNFESDSESELKIINFNNLDFSESNEKNNKDKNIII